MTLNELKAWLEGFEESIDEAPTAEQWAKIKEKIAELHMEPERLRDILPPARPYWDDDFSPAPWASSPLWGNLQTQ